MRAEQKSRYFLTVPILFFPASNQELRNLAQVGKRLPLLGGGDFEITNEYHSQATPLIVKLGPLNTIVV